MPKIEIYDWVDLHRLAMASREAELLSDLTMTRICITQAETDIKDRCFSLVRENVVEAVNRLNNILTELMRSEDFAINEMKNLSPPKTPKDE